MNNLNNDLSQNVELEKSVTQEQQNNFLETNIGKTINCALDIGLKTVLPDCIENEIIEIKDAFITNGFEGGIQKTINNAIELGKNIVGIFKGTFTNIEQVENAVKEGGLIDGISNTVDFIVDKIEKKGIITENISELIKDGKDFILENIEERIKDNFNMQKVSLNNLNNYIEDWKNNYNNQDLIGMNNTYENLKETVKNVIPLESVMKSVNQIENLQVLLKNNNGKMDLSKEQIELSKILV